MSDTLLTAKIGMAMWILLSLLFISGCSIMIGNDSPESAKGSQYKIHFNSENWKEKEDQRSDYIWENVRDGRILMSNSFCNEFQDQPLEALATKTFKMVNEYRPDKQGYTTFNDREAFRMEGTGSVDGVPVYITLLNTRRNNCYFDFVSITPTETSKVNRVEFETFLKGVEFK